VKKSDTEEFIDVVKIVPITYRRNYSKVLMILASTDLYLVTCSQNNRFFYESIHSGQEQDKIRFWNEEFYVLIGNKYLTMEVKKIEKITNTTKYLKLIIKS
jgi:hypothetical protein